MEEKTEIEQNGETLEELVKADMEERRKALYRHKLPAKLELLPMLEAMTKAELDDIRYNLNVTGASSLKKAELAERLSAEIVDFAQRWFPSMLEEEYGCFQHLIEHDGLTTEFRDDDVRLDYLRGLGLVSCGKQEDKLAWYMPKEVQAEFTKLDSGAFRSLTELNTEVTRLASGCLFHYGYMNYDQLYAKVMGYLDEAQREQVSFMDFVGVMLNASCWQNTLVALPQGAKYYTLIDENSLESEQIKRSNLDFAALTYSQVYDAGTESYIDATTAYKDLAQFFMREHDCDVLKAADIVGEILILLQNGGNMQEAVEYLEELGMMKDERKAEAVVPLLIAYNNSTHLWPLKGHTPEELMAAAGQGKVIPFEEVRRRKVGRNEPCPCGSGKKYKNCCLHKDEN
ncbi:SEC-C motif-containing protein [Selenomonas sp. GACV-9]|uniref:YecA family protein n=1 Tax=Selenomonas sp. GACV-9 TaxID=3158782 RepID=UPI0008F09BFC|nr:SEC-C motif-containing protein [Selenomonas ruminantium]